MKEALQKRNDFLAVAVNIVLATIPLRDQPRKTREVITFWASGNC